MFITLKKKGQRKDIRNKWILVITGVDIAKL